MQGIHPNAVGDYWNNLDYQSRFAFAKFEAKWPPRSAAVIARKTWSNQSPAARGVIRYLLPGIKSQEV